MSEACANTKSRQSEPMRPVAPRSGMVSLVIVLLATSMAGAQQQQQRPGTPPQIELDFRVLRRQPGPRMTAADVLALLDVDGDGTISAAEWRERRMAIFYLLDANSDVYLDRGELHRMPDQTFAAADLEQDGRLSGFEFNQATFAQFETSDADRDGRVTSVEFERFRRDFAGP
jgi:Ca2+-binding EF-hand superfamily protein